MTINLPVGLVTHQLLIGSITVTDSLITSTCTELFTIDGVRLPVRETSVVVATGPEAVEAIRNSSREEQDQVIIGAVSAHFGLVATNPNE